MNAIEVKNLTRMNTLYEGVAESKVMSALSATDDKDIYVAGSVTFGVEVTPDAKQAKYLFKIENTAASAKTIRVLKGTNTVTATIDLELSIPASGSAVIQLDTAKYMFLEGGRKGKMIFASNSADVKVGAYKLV